MGYGSVPLISQVKSAFQFLCGDWDGAKETQNEFFCQNTFPVISQIVSATYWVGGDREKAWNLQKQFGQDMLSVVDSIPGVGHLKGGVHYYRGEREQGDESMKAGTRTTAVITGGVIGSGLGPIGAVVGGVLGAATMDSVITVSDKYINEDNGKSYGYLRSVEKIRNGEVEGAGGVFDIAMQPLTDGLLGYSAGEFVGDRYRIGKRTQTTAPGGTAPKNRLGLDQKALDNRANQLNPNHVKTGPGRPAGYHGDMSKAALDNHANQLNPNHVKTGPVKQVRSTGNGLNTNSATTITPGGAPGGGAGRATAATFESSSSENCSTQGREVTWFFGRIFAS